MMNKNKFIDYVNRSNESQRISEDEIRKIELRSNAISIIHRFISGISNDLADLKLKPDQYEIIHDGFGGLVYSGDQLLFLPNYPIDLANDDLSQIVVVFNGDVIDRLITKDDKIISEGHHTEISQELLESYLANFIKD